MFDVSDDHFTSAVQYTNAQVRMHSKFLIIFNNFFYRNNETNTNQKPDFELDFERTTFLFRILNERVAASIPFPFWFLTLQIIDQLKNGFI